MKMLIHSLTVLIAISTSLPWAAASDETRMSKITEVYRLSDCDRILTAGVTSAFCSIGAELMPKVTAKLQSQGLSSNAAGQRASEMVKDFIAKGVDDVRQSNLSADCQRSFCAAIDKSFTDAELDYYLKFSQSPLGQSFWKSQVESSEKINEVVVGRLRKLIIDYAEQVYESKKAPAIPTIRVITDSDYAGIPKDKVDRLSMIALAMLPEAGDAQLNRENSSNWKAMVQTIFNGDVFKRPEYSKARPQAELLLSNTLDKVNFGREARSAYAIELNRRFTDDELRQIYDFCSNPQYVLLDKKLRDAAKDGTDQAMTSMHTKLDKIIDDDLERVFGAMFSAPKTNGTVSAKSPLKPGQHK